MPKVINFDHSTNFNSGALAVCTISLDVDVYELSSLVVPAAPLLS